MRILIWLAATVLSTGSLNSSIYAEPIEDAQQRLELTISYLDELSQEINFQNEATELKFLKAQRELDQLRTLLVDIKAIVSKEGQIEKILDQADFVREIMAAYLHPAEFPSGSFVLTNPGKNAVDIVIDTNVIFEEVIRDLGFIDIGGNGKVTIRSGRNYKSEFNKLKTKYHALLTKAWAIDEDDKRLKSLIEWGKDTKVKQSEEELGFGQSIISFSDF